MFKGWKNLLKQKEEQESQPQSIITQLINYFRILKRDIDRKKKFLLICFGILSIYVASFFRQNYLWLIGKQTKLYLDPISMLYTFFTSIHIVLPLALVCFLFLNYLRMYIRKAYGKEYTEDDKLNIKVLEKDDSYGSGHWMTEKEKQNAFFMSKDIADITADILGIDDEDRLVARKALKYTNGNVGIVGAPGCGKSTCMVYNNIFQCIRRGESCIAVDSKGTVYKTTAHIAKKAGYTVKVFNTKPDELEFSDGVDFFKIIPDDKRRAPQIANTLTTVIMHYISDPKDRSSIWYTGSFNLLKAMVLIVKFSSDIPKKKKTLQTTYNLLAENSVEELEAMFEYINYDKNHPAYYSWRTFVHSRDVVKESVHGGLVTNLNLFQNEYVQKITSTDEIDLVKPGREKCIYYVIIDDVDKSNNLLAAMFFECAGLLLKNDADGRKEEKLAITTLFEIDEYYAIHGLPNFTEKLSTYRSRGIPIHWYIQDISQMVELYGKDTYRMIIACCTTMICIKAGEQMTASYFSERLGSVTIQIDNTKINEYASKIVQDQPVKSISEGKGSRPLLYPAEILGQGEKGMDDDHLLVTILSQPPIILRKYQFTEHPFFKYIKDEMPNEHIPEWRKSMIEEERKEKEMAKRQKQRKGMVTGAYRMMPVELHDNREATASEPKRDTQMVWKEKGNGYVKSGKL